MEKKNKAPRFVKADPYVKYYTNSARIVRTPWDVSVVFGQSDTHSIVPEGGEGIVISDGVEVVMSYQHILSLYNLLKGHVEAITSGGKKEEGTAH